MLWRIVLHMPVGMAVLFIAAVDWKDAFRGGRYHPGEGGLIDDNLEKRNKSSC